METVIIGIITATITAITSITVCLLNNKAQLRNIDIEQDKRATEQAHAQEMAMAQLQASIQENLAIITTSLDHLAGEVREHNNFAKRMPVVEEKIRTLEDRVTKLEAKLEKV